MMKAENTVMDVLDEKFMDGVYGWMRKLDDQESGDLWWMEHNAIAQTQAEITWDIAEKAGMQKVVSFILEHSQLERCDPDVMTYFVDYLAIDYPDWQAFLEEKGL